MVHTIYWNVFTIMQNLGYYGYVFGAPDVA
jgi:hypothetical protein